MSEPSVPTRADLLDALDHLFDGEELRTLCFKLNIAYDDLPGEGQTAKARELIGLAERTDRVDELVEAIRRERSSFGVNYSFERVQQLQASILQTARSDVRDAFVEFTQQIEAYLNEFNLLHQQIQEWKEVHNLYQEIQMAFSPCRGYISALGFQEGSGRAAQKNREKLLYETEVNWRACRRHNLVLQNMASTIHVINEPNRVGSIPVQDWFRQTLYEWNEIDRALHESNVSVLSEHMSAFSEQVDRCLFMADKSLRDVIGKINQLPRPGGLTARRA